MEMRRELAQTKDELRTDQIALLLGNLTNYVHTKTVREGSGPRGNEAHVCELRIYAQVHAKIKN